MKGRTAVLLFAGLTVGFAGCDQGPTTPTTDPAAEPVVADPLSADLRLDAADDNLEKAIALLLAAENPITQHPDRPFGGHRTKAVALLEKARDEVAAAAAYADDPKNAP